MKLVQKLASGDFEGGYNIWRSRRRVFQPRGIPTTIVLERFPFDIARRSRAYYNRVNSIV